MVHYRCMSDRLKKLMMTPEAGAKTLLQVSPEEPAWETEPIPASALKELRQNRTQIEIARAAGISQGFLSELESGQKRLTPGVAQRLAPVLGTTAPQLVLGEHLARLDRAAQKGHIDLQTLLAEAERLTEILPDGEIGDAIIDAIVRVVRERQKLPN
jgi:transcriptional regulator with XRE-family HTH domain